LLGPRFEIAASSSLLSQIRFQLFVDVDEGGGQGDTIGNREGKSVGLAGAVIGVLTENDHFDLVDRDAIEGVENKPGERIDGAVFVFLFDELGQVGKIRLIKLILQ